MPILQNPRHEAFAQARAKGAFLDDAYEDAGFAPGNGHASRLALTPNIAERIGELRALNAQLDEANPQAMIAALLALAEAGEALADVPGVIEARLAILDAWRLRADWSAERDRDREEVLKTTKKYYNSDY